MGNYILLLTENISAAEMSLYASASGLYVEAQEKRMNAKNPEKKHICKFFMPDSV